ncbi:MAG: RES domain-containing protein, partial [Deltaproteobacteria bacterium]
PQERTAFCVPVASQSVVDLTSPPLVRDRAIWAHPTAYDPCQALADRAREAGVQALRYESVRDPSRGANLAVFSPQALSSKVPMTRETWWLMLRRDRVEALREMPRMMLSFMFTGWADDLRIPDAMGGDPQPA